MQKKTKQTNKQQTTKKQNKLIIKSLENLKIPIFAPFLGQKDFFSKIGFHHSLGITILESVQKYQKNTIIQSEEKLA